MEKVWIRKGKPKRIFEKDDVHYFYWPIEIGYGFIRMKDFKIPTFPLKRLDYEPIKVLKHFDKFQVISRFHYRVLLYFNNPVEVDGRNVVDFSFGSHSPYVISEASCITSEMLVDGMDAREISALYLLIGIYISIISNKLRTEINHLEDYDVEKDEIPDEALFDINRPAAVVWVGIHPTKENTPDFLFKIICPERK